MHKDASVNQQEVEAALDSAFREELQQLFSHFVHHADEAALETGMDRLISRRAIAERLIAQRSQPAAAVEWAGGGLTSS